MFKYLTIEGTVVIYVPSKNSKIILSKLINKYSNLQKEYYEVFKN